MTSPHTCTLVAGEDPTSRELRLPRTGFMGWRTPSITTSTKTKDGILSLGSMHTDCPQTGKKWGLQYQTLEFRTHSKSEFFKLWYWEGSVLEWSGVQLQPCTRTDYSEMESVHKNTRWHPDKSQPFENWTIHQPNSFEPFEIQTCSVFELAHFISHK